MREVLLQGQSGLLLREMSCVYGNEISERSRFRNSWEDLIAVVLPVSMLVAFPRDVSR